MTNPVRITAAKVIEGNALSPGENDIIYLEGRLDVGKPVPEGWRVLTGNNINSLVVWVGYRYELEDQLDD